MKLREVSQSEDREWEREALPKSRDKRGFKRLSMTNTVD